MDARDDADEQRVLVSERTADDGNGLADPDAGRAAERDRTDRMGLRIDLDHTHVVEDVPADDPRLDAVAGGRLDVDPRPGRRRGSRRSPAGVSDHVRAPQDQPGTGDDETGALSLLAT